MRILPAILALSSIIPISINATATDKPNIVFIFADDMGYGDVQCLNPLRGKIPTPHLDKLASEGMIFTDAHTTSSVCTPTRYSLITGRYHWRTKLQKGVTQGYSLALISPNTLTVGNVLQQSGYTTAMIGKWHIGMNLPTVDGQAAHSSTAEKRSNVNWTGDILEGPFDKGFDYFYGTSASLDMPPYVYIENRKFLDTPTELKAFHRLGDASADFEDIDVLDHYGEKASEYIKKQNSEKPFFLYVPLTSPHTPIVPTEEWQGKSGINSYADFQMQTDAVIGRIIQAVNDAEFRDNTIVIVSSDNGCSKMANFDELEAAGHYASAQFRGSKSDIWEGGHRVPFIVRWPAQVKAGSQCDQTICLVDFLASVADIVEFTIPETAAGDSVSFLPALEGKEILSERKGIVSQSVSGSFAYRMGDWKLILCAGSGGWSSPRNREANNLPNATKGQLYNLADDIREENNLYIEKPEIVEKLLKQLESEVANGRSTPGPRLENSLPVANIKLWK